MDVTDLVLYELNSALKYADKREPSTLTQEDLDRYIKEVKIPIISKALNWNEEDTKELERIYGKRRNK